MNTCKALKCDLVIVGPFGIAPFTSGEWVAKLLFSDQIQQSGIPMKTLANIDTARGVFSCETIIDPFSVRAESSRLTIQSDRVDGDHLEILCSSLCNLVGQFPFATAVAVGFNVLFEISLDCDSNRDLLESVYDGLGNPAEESHVFELDSDCNLRISSFRDLKDAHKLRVSFNFHKELLSTVQPEPPLIISKNWCTAHPLSARLAFAKDIVYKRWGIEDGQH